MFRTASLVWAVAAIFALAGTAQGQVKHIQGELKQGQTENIEKMKLKANTKYVIRMNSEEFDTYVRVRDDQNQEVASNDDGGGGLNSKLEFTPPKDGEYQIAAGSFGNSGMGKYNLEVVAMTAMRPEGKLFSKVGKIDGNSQTLDGLPYETHKLKMDKGKSYLIEFKSNAFDPILGVRPVGNKKPIDLDDDGGEGLNSKLLFYPSQSGEYELILGSLNGQQGEFTVTVQTMASRKKEPK